MEVLVEKKLRMMRLLQEHGKLSCKTFICPFLLEIGCAIFHKKCAKKLSYITFHRLQFFLQYACFISVRLKRQILLYLKLKFLT